jgi:hypothetical protein
MSKKYLLCIGTSDSHKGALNFICEKLKKNPELSVELFTVVRQTGDGTMFGPDQNEELVKEIENMLEQNKAELEKTIRNKVLTSCYVGTLSKGLESKLVEDNDIIAIVLGMSNISEKKQTILKLIEEKKDILYNIPIIIIPQSITEVQIMDLI